MMIMMGSSYGKGSFHFIMMMMMVMMMMMMMGMDGVVGFKEFKVGGRYHGWNIPESNETDFFDHWASKKRFHVGDSLVFQYQNDSVLVVDKYGYYHCDPSKATRTYNDGNTIIKLEQPGLIYFISGSVDRCHDGLRMAVDVMSRHAAHSPASPPESGDQAEAPSPSVRINSGSHLVPTLPQVSSFLGVVFVSSMFF